MNTTTFVVVCLCLLPRLQVLRPGACRLVITQDMTMHCISVKVGDAVTVETQLHGVHLDFATSIQVKPQKSSFSLSHWKQ